MSIRGETPRLYGMDALRSVLMLLGVVIHAADPYAVGSRWLVRDPQGQPVFDGIVEAIHTFRMPAFFLVSGYFSMLLLSRWSAAHFLRDRARRIGLPLLACLLTVNTLQVLWLAERAPGSEWQWRTWSDAWFSGHWLGHLWFLAYLLVYCLIGAALAPWVTRTVARAAPYARWRVPLLMGLGTLALLLPRALTYLQPDLGTLTVAGVFDPLEVLFYLPFYTAGLWLQADPGLLEEFSQFSWRQVAWALASVLLLRVADAMHGGFVAKIAVALAGAWWTWWVVRGVLALALRALDRPWRGWRYLADASYSVYLFHHVIVVMAATLLIGVEISLPLKFLLVLTLALLIPLAAHQALILRHPWLQWLFNGRALPRAEHGEAAERWLRTSSDPRSP